MSEEPKRNESRGSPSPGQKRRPDVSRAPGTPPQRQQEIRFSPFAGGFAVFTAIAIPVIVFGYTRAAGPDDLIIGIGIIVGLLAGLIAGLWLARRGGRVWRGPQL